MHASRAEGGAYSDAPDELLAAKAVDDFTAFSELYRRYLNPIYGFIRSQIPDDTVAEDITAHVFFKALSSASTFRGDGTYRSWLFRIAHNSIFSWRDRSGRALAVAELPEKVDPAPSPATQAIASEAANVVWAKVAELPPAQREVITLKYADDLSTEEIASVTDRSRGAVRILLHRAKTRLRHSLEGRDLL
jgi:RNA polymerase sigma-70 factor (ECF subfamily)